MSKRNLRRKGFIWLTQLTSVHHWQKRRLQPGGKSWSLHLTGFLLACLDRQYQLPGNGTAHSGLGFPTSIANQELLPQPCLQAHLFSEAFFFFSWESLFSDDSRQCQVDTKLSRTFWNSPQHHQKSLFSLLERVLAGFVSPAKGDHSPCNGPLKLGIASVFLLLSKLYKAYPTHLRYICTHTGIYTTYICICIYMSFVIRTQDRSGTMYIYHI